MNLQFRKIALSSATILSLTAFAGASLAQTPTPAATAAGDQGGNYGPGTMNGYGPGYGAGMMGGAGGGYWQGMMGGAGYGYGSGMMNGYGPGYGRSANSKTIVADQFDVLKQELKITSDQEPAWKSYIDAVTASDQKFWTAMRSKLNPGTNTTLAPDDRFTIMSQMLTLRKQNFDDQKAAAGALLTKLTPYQSGQASVILPGLAQGGGFQGGSGNGMGFGGYGMGPGMMNY